MIKYALECEHDHPFEGWFGASTDFEDQQNRGLVECPMCGSRAVRKQIMSPAVAGTKAQAEPAFVPAKGREMMQQAMGKIRELVESHFEYVGDGFASEARAIHEGRSEERGIYGEASPQDVRSLVDDGVNVSPMPPAPPKKTEVN
jgi:hypothetical protein